MKVDLKKLWNEKVVPYLKDGVENMAKPAIEVYVEKMIEAKSDLYVDKVAAAIKFAIPGDGIPEALIDSKLAKIKAELKAALLAEAEKISDKV